MKQIKIINCQKWNWYKLDEVFTVKDDKKYSNIGVQVFKEDNRRGPDVVQNGHFKYI